MDKPIVAIVGRPNVGKSTLFNRIIGRKEAIVDDQPGVTRDRKYADAEWQQAFFTLIDTGGYIPRTGDVIETGVTAQVRYAMDEADLILYVVDATTDITDVDGDVAELLRKGGKHCILVANKADNPARELDAARFYRLGLGEVMPVSAIGGRGIGDLLSAVTAHLADLDFAPSAPPLDDAVRIAVVGRPNAGKSTYINTVLGEERLLVTETPGTTRDAVDVRFRTRGRDVLFIDTAGLRRRKRVSEDVEFYSTLRTRRAIAGCDVACVFVDVTEGPTQQDMHVLNEVIERRKGIVVVVNKWDVIADDPHQVWLYRQNLDQKMQGLDYVPVLEISCKSGLRVKRVLRMALDVAAEREKRIPSPDLNRLIEAFHRHYQPPAVRGKRIRVMYGAQIGVKPPLFSFFLNYPELLKPEYKRYMENRLRREFGFRGVPVSMLFRKK
ncbi:MAG TPA: ribosome biogenesis GTPase Der [bacterium]|nr:ribosome biogenesis GTPase Der [bacterium]